MTWPRLQLHELTSKIGSGATPTGGHESYKAEGVPFIRSMNVHDGQFREQGIAYLDEKQAKQLDVVILCRGDVLLNITGASVGRVCCLPDRYVGGRVNQHVAIIRPRPEVLDSTFLQYYLTDRVTKANLLRIAGAGATREAITKSAIEHLEISVPPLEEQKRIAAILDQADELRRRRQRALDRLNQLGQAIFLEMFGDPRAESGWNCDVAELSTICRKITDGTHQAPNWAGSGIPFLFVSNIRNQRIDMDTKKFVSIEEFESLTKHTKIESHDILYTCVGSYGHTAVVDGSTTFAFQRHIAHLKPNLTLVLPHFLAWCLETPNVKAQADKLATGIAQKTVTLSALKKFLVPLPSLDAQKEFESRISEVLRLRDVMELEATRIVQLFSSIQQSALRGELSATSLKGADA